MTDDDGLEPDVWLHLTNALDIYRSEHGERFAGPKDDDEAVVHKALEALENHAFQIVTTAKIPEELGEALAAFQPEMPLPEKVSALLEYNVSRHAIEFDVTRDILWQLSGLPQRIQGALVAFALLIRARPSETALKYLRQATTLYLAGYTTEVFVMCGAVLEAALADRYSDQRLVEKGWRPKHQHTEVFSLGQRMKFERDDPCFDEEEREQFWQVINWRNDAVHVQPDIAPKPALAIIFTAILLGAILPQP